MWPFITLILYAHVFHRTLADTPANCTYEDARGKWLIEVCDFPSNCSEVSHRQFEIELQYPNIAWLVSGYESVGVWTMIYNQGFEVNVANRKWLVMFAYNGSQEYTCDHGMPGFSQDNLLRQRYWFTARKLAPSSRIHHRPSSFSATLMDEPYRSNPDFVAEINSVQNSWVADSYPELENYSWRELRRRSGGVQSMFTRRTRLSNPTRNSPELEAIAGSLPSHFDWCHPTDGRPSPVTPVRNQESCGSCYAFASAAAVEARVRLLSNFTENPILSPQDVVDCSPYSQGCDGGFPYLISGKYAEVFGMPEEACNPYTGKQAPTCPTKKDCRRYYSTNYRYIGGYYGMCNEHLMKLELVHGGPFAIGFEVYDDFVHYKSGVYRHTNVVNKLSRFNPFELTNHAVLLVGYGVDSENNLPYWIVKNSWGTSWGEDGFFRILRGADECAVESLGVAFDVVL